MPRSTHISLDHVQFYQPPAPRPPQPTANIRPLSSSALSTLPQNSAVPAPDISAGPWGICRATSSREVIEVDETQCDASSRDDADKDPETMPPRAMAGSVNAGLPPDLGSAIPQGPFSPACDENSIPTQFSVYPPGTAPTRSAAMEDFPFSCTRESMGRGLGSSDTAMGTPTTSVHLACHCSPLGCSSRHGDTVSALFPAIDTDRTQPPRPVDMRDLDRLLDGWTNGPTHEGSALGRGLPCAGAKPLNSSQSFGSQGLACSSQ
ncbi:hypothetical protein SODALDRAFT_65725 [Sodiomyces alkalinus F11]|uniref:Uncharacterized protein n=1 Tax=Sodiomyces alkalinus (strain CBS 110278 / VKM F-3762 / F11) TaxID=1314773 RepID=A0A3N2PM57_SODAK|nr:hypothetical protein SODALDRAFT_65725 [Sodiomyces alkalinus F11]ROT35426.1 hypothetical protein SODALDRAFT_65725 [Sodiomyces alkalinus F11]